MDARHRIALATAANVVETAPKADATYTREWNAFQKFVDEKRGLEELPLGPRYLTRDNVDLYFAEKIAYRREVMPETARRAVSGLQFFAKHLEYIDGSETVIVDNSDAVTRALDAQRQRYFECIADQEMLDPHANLPTDVLSEEDHEKAIHEIFFKNYPNWQDLALSWTLCTQTYVRNHSASMFVFADLKVDRSHGPEKHGSEAKIMSYIMRHGRHKKKHDKTKVVGAWRHTDFRRCSTGILAMALMTRLHYNRNRNIYMTANNNSPWRKGPLISGWKDQRSALKAYNALLQATNISWGKVTHMRKTGMEQSSARGDLDPKEQSTMSKHKTDDLAVFRYATELYTPVMHVMAGFARKDAYFVPRTKISPPTEWGDVTALIFPDIDIWRWQVDAPNGDKSSAARNFLYETLPFLAHVAVQDGIFWLQQYPDHAISILLRHLLPPAYEQWAHDQRQWVAQQISDFEQSRTLELSGAAQASYNLLSARVNTLEAHC
jgi:hypothetical protein